MAEERAGLSEHPHPGPGKYVFIAVVLALVTAVEVAIYYIPGAGSILVPSLISFSLVKFVLVVAYFMHLRFDSKLFRRLFLIGIVLTLGVFAVVLATILLRGGPAPEVTEALLRL